METKGSWTLTTDYVDSWAVADGAFSIDECKKIIELGSNLQTMDPSVKTIHGYLNDTSIRDSKLSWIYPNDENEWIFRRLTDYVTVVNDKFFRFNLFGFIEGLQFTRYDAPSGFYGMHIDKAYGRTIRKLSLTIQLSDPNEYEGGELALQTAVDPVIMEKKQGKLIAFPSYVMHEVKPVTKGTRYSLVAWVTGEPFK